MDASTFWDLINLVDREALARGDEEAAAEKLKNQLSKQSVSEIKSFYNHLANFLFKLDTREHCESSLDSTDDGFLYTRCYVIGMGKSTYESVRRHPDRTPPATKSFESLLYVPERAWAKKTGVSDDQGWDFIPSKSFETGSNSKGWPITDRKLLSIGFRDTNDLLRALQQADPPELCSVALKCDELGWEYVRELSRLNFTTTAFGGLSLKLTTEIRHSNFRQIEDTIHGVPQFDVGLDPQWYAKADKGARRQFIVEVVTVLLKSLVQEDQKNIEKLELAQASLLGKGN